jgi:hypothetical protein
MNYARTNFPDDDGKYIQEQLFHSFCAIEFAAQVSRGPLGCAIKMLTKVLTYLLLLAALLGQSCTDFGVEPTLQDDEDDVREAAFRYFFEHNYSGGVEKIVDVFFLSINSDPYPTEPDHDPSDRFMSRFAGHQPEVKKYSDCEIVDWVLVERQTGKSGMLFFTGFARKLDANRIELWGGYYATGVNASFNRLVLRRVYYTRWIVESDELEGIA